MYGVVYSYRREWGKNIIKSKLTCIPLEEPGMNTWNNGENLGDVINSVWQRLGMY